MKILEAYAAKQSAADALLPSLLYAFDHATEIDKNNRLCKLFITSLLGLLADSLATDCTLLILDRLPSFFASLKRYPVLQKASADVLVKLVFYSSTSVLQMQATKTLVLFARTFRAQRSLVMRRSYAAFLRTCRSITSINLHRLSLSTDFLLDIAFVDDTTAVNILGKAMRLMAGEVRDALKGNATAISSVQSWRFVAQLRFFSGLLSSSKATAKLGVLRMPFVGLASAALGVKLSLTKLPFHFHVVDSLLSVSSSTDDASPSKPSTTITRGGMLIPACISHLLSILALLSLHSSHHPDRSSSKASGGKSGAKPKHFWFASLLSIGEGECHAGLFQEAAIDEVFYLLLKGVCCAKASCWVGFPEICNGLICMLKGDGGSTAEAPLKGAAGSRIKRHVRALLDKCAVDARAIAQLRVSNSLTPRKTRIDGSDACDGAKMDKNGGTGELERFREATERMRAIRAKTALGDLDQDANGPKNCEGDAAKSDDNSVGQQKKRERKANSPAAALAGPRKKKAKRTDDGDEDVVKDFVLSSSESD